MFNNIDINLYLIILKLLLQNKCLMTKYSKYIINILYLRSK